jgi:predicted ATPase
VGREAELDAALKLIGRADVRLVTLSGPGGIGKTRLALELAARLADRSLLVELAALRDPVRVLPSIATAIGAPDSTEEAVASVLRAKPAVLFLDNFEHVIGAADLVAPLTSWRRCSAWLRR